MGPERSEQRSTPSWQEIDARLPVGGGSACYIYVGQAHTCWADRNVGGRCGRPIANTLMLCVDCHLEIVGDRRPPPRLFTADVFGDICEQQESVVTEPAA